MNYNFSTYIPTQQRADIYLAALFSGFSRSYIQKLLKKEKVLINGKTVKKNAILQPKDEIFITIEIVSTETLAEDIPLDIIFEDTEILIVNKEAGMNVHPVPGDGGNTGTLVNAILHHCKENLPTIGGEERPGIVHRLDKDTSGILMIAKSDRMMQYLSQTIAERNIEKYYLAVVGGIVTEREFTIQSEIGRDRNDRKKMTAHQPLNGKNSISHVKVLSYVDEKHTLLQVKIETGRTHQIRVHLSSMGYPILGDKVYGNPKVNKEVATRYQLKRQALHAHKLVFKLHGEKREFIADLKDDMKKFVK